MTSPERSPARRALATFALFAGSVLAASALAQAGGDYRMDPSAVAGGGGIASGGAYRLSGTFGQSATARLSGSAFVLHDGFWGPAAGTPPVDAIFANGFDP